VLIVWGIAVGCALAATVSLRVWQRDIVEHLAYTTASPEVRATFLIRRADSYFEQARMQATEMGEGALSKSREAKEAERLYTQALQLHAEPGLVSVFDKLVALRSWLGDKEGMHLASALAHMWRREFDAAIEAGQKCNEVEGRVVVCDAMLELGRMDEAGEKIALLAQEAPDHLDVVIIQAALETRRARKNLGEDKPDAATRHWNNAAELLERATTIDPKRLATYTLLSDHYRLLGMLDRSQDTLRRAIDHSPENATLYHRLGLIQLEAGDPDQAMESIQQAIDKLDNIPVLHLDLRRAALAAGNQRVAVAALERAMALDPVATNKALAP